MPQQQKPEPGPFEQLLIDEVTEKIQDELYQATKQFSLLCDRLGTRIELDVQIGAVTRKETFYATKLINLINTELLRTLLPHRLRERGAEYLKEIRIMMRERAEANRPNAELRKNPVAGS